MAIDIEKLKAGGFIAQCEKDLFSLRVRIPCGDITSSQIKLLSDISEKSVIERFKECAKRRERLGDIVERLGVEEFKI